MGSQVDIRTGNEYADEELDLSKIQPILQNYEQPKVSKIVEPNLLESIVACNEIEEENVAEELVNGHNHPQVMNRKNNSGNISDVRIQRSANASQMKLEKPQATENSGMIAHNSREFQNFSKNGQIPPSTHNINQSTKRRYCNKFTPSHYFTKGVEYYQPTYSHQNSHCSVPSNVSEKRHNCQHCSNVCDNAKNGSSCNGICKMNSYKLSTIGIADSNKSMKSKEDEATQTSHSIYQKMAHCSKPMHHQIRSDSNFIKPNVHSRQKCICKGIYEQSSRKNCRVNSSTVNAKKLHASKQQLLSTSNHHHKRGCRRPVVRISYQNKLNDDVIKCHGCGRYTLCKYRNGRSNNIRYNSACHPHNNDKNHSSGIRHTYCCKHH